VVLYMDHICAGTQNPDLQRFCRGTDHVGTCTRFHFMKIYLYDKKNAILEFNMNY
jgi:hypothetical protein